jgi:hypothetical protein
MGWQRQQSSTGLPVPQLPRIVHWCNDMLLEFLLISNGEVQEMGKIDVKNKKRLISIVSVSDFLAAAIDAHPADRVHEFLYISI